MTRGDDLQLTHDDYNTTTDYQCLDEIMINKPDKSNSETMPIVLAIQDQGQNSEGFIEAYSKLFKIDAKPGPSSSSFKIKVEILKASSKPTQKHSR